MLQNGLKRQRDFVSGGCLRAAEDVEAGDNKMNH